jgi:hypothetical protein
MLPRNSLVYAPEARSHVFALLGPGHTRPSPDLVIKLSHGVDKLHRGSFSTELLRQLCGPLEKVIGDLRTCQQAAKNRTKDHQPVRSGVCLYGKPHTAC